MPTQFPPSTCDPPNSGPPPFFPNFFSLFCFFGHPFSKPDPPKSILPLSSSPTFSLLPCHLSLYLPQLFGSPTSIAITNQPKSVHHLPPSKIWPLSYSSLAFLSPAPPNPSLSFSLLTSISSHRKPPPPLKLPSIYFINRLSSSSSAFNLHDANSVLYPSGHQLPRLEAWWLKLLLSPSTPPNRILVSLLDSLQSRGSPSLVLRRDSDHLGLTVWSSASGKHAGLVAFVAA